MKMKRLFFQNKLADIILKNSNLKFLSMTLKKLNSKIYKYDIEKFEISKHTIFDYRNFGMLIQNWIVNDEY